MREAFAASKSPDEFFDRSGQIHIAVDEKVSQMKGSVFALMVVVGDGHAVLHGIAIILNASPRKGWSTAQLLKETRQGTEEAGAETEYREKARQMSAKLLRQADAK